MLPFIWFAFVALWGSVISEKYRKNLIYGNSTGFMDLRLLEAEATSEVQLLIVGSSHVYRGIDPRRFEERGISTFNFGSSLQSPIQTEYLLKKYLDQMNPDIVLFEVGYKTFSTNGIEGALDIIINSPALGWDILDMALEVNDISVYNTLAYTLFRKNILGETRQDYLSKHTDLDVYIPGGFVLRRDSVYIGPESFDRTVKPLQALQQKSFERCLMMLKERNIKTILIQTPILQEYYTSIENIDEFNNYFSKLSGTHHYYNFNEDMYKETRYFYDHHHLNSIGVDRFNNDLIEAILPHLDVLSQR
jgi:hypothetical protein